MWVLFQFKFSCQFLAHHFQLAREFGVNASVLLCMFVSQWSDPLNHSLKRTGYSPGVLDSLWLAVACPFIPFGCCFCRSCTRPPCSAFIVAAHDLPPRAVALHAYIFRLVRFRSAERAGLEFSCFHGSGCLRRSFSSALERRSDAFRSIVSHSGPT